MARIDLKEVCVEFPVYNQNSRSLKKQFLRVATGGAVVEDKNHCVVVNALKDITLSIKAGDRVGLIGHNGSGKSTFLRLLAGVYEATSGQFRIEGQVCPVLDIMHGIEAEFNGYDNIVSRGTILGHSRQNIKQALPAIKEFSGLGDYLTMPMRTYSAGMMVRLAFAISTSVMPDILLLDEVFGAGDADFLSKAKDRLMTLLDQSNIVVMATHSDELIREFCNRAVLFESGQIKFVGDVDKALEIYHHKESLT